MAQRRGQRDIAFGMALALLVALAGCGTGSQRATRGNATATRQSGDALTRIHVITPESLSLFVRVTFDPETTYDQALAILIAEPHPANPYLWTCDDPRTPTPPSPAELRAAFAATHAIYLSYPTWDQVTRIASSDHVLAVDDAVLYMCP